MFGHKTERFKRKDDENEKDKNDDKDQNPTGSSKSESNETKRGNKGSGGGRKGRNGKNDYPGADHKNISHETLKERDPCPQNCPDSSLKRIKDGVSYHWFGQNPLTLVIFHLERLICHTCKTTYTATAPHDSLPQKEKSEPAQVQERSVDPTAIASLAALRFEMGVPHHRLSQFQESLGVPLPASSQSMMMEPLREPAEKVFSSLEKTAANGDLILNDDTHGRILDLERGNIPIVPAQIEQKTTKEPLLRPTNICSKKQRKKAITSSIISHYGEHKICLFYTGLLSAGKNLNSILIHRKTEANTPLQMCDGASANIPNDFDTLLGNCLDHARRKFYDLESHYPDEVRFILQNLRKIYDFDAQAKQMNLNPKDRLSWHIKNSKPIMDSIKKWAEDLKLSDTIPPNSPLFDQAIDYMLPRWKELTLFLREPGAPLSNSEVERAIKNSIRHRKNSLQYKTMRGARFGDLMMSLIQTCKSAKVSTYSYLTALVEYSEEVIAHPESWLPWNFHLTLAQKNK